MTVRDDPPSIYRTEDISMTDVWVLIILLVVVGVPWLFGISVILKSLWNFF